jgi:hypothetical protein
MCIVLLHHADDARLFAAQLAPAVEQGMALVDHRVDALGHGMGMVGHMHHFRLDGV